MSGRVRKVPAAGIITTAASGFSFQLAVAADAAGDLYIADEEYQ